MKKQFLIGLIAAVTALTSCNQESTTPITVLDQLVSEPSWSYGEGSQLFSFNYGDGVFVQASHFLSGDCYTFLDMTDYELVNTVSSSPEVLEIQYSDPTSGELLYSRTYQVVNGDMVATVVVHSEGDTAYSLVITPFGVPFSELNTCQ